jgi:hypothetical protein
MTREDGTNDRVDVETTQTWTCHPRVTFSGELEPGTCAVCGAMPTTGVVAWMFDESTRIGLCDPCAHSISMPVPFGKEHTFKSLRHRFTVKRFHSGAREGQLDVCRFSGRTIVGDAVAVWRGKDLLVFCVACARGIERAVTRDVKKSRKAKR